MPLVDVNQKPAAARRKAANPPRSPAAASLQPICDVFNRLGALGGWDGVGRRGDVARGLDPHFKKIVLTLGGSTARSACILPKRGELGLKARFVYVQYARASPSKPASIELELTRRKTQDSCRVSLSSSHAAPYKIAGGALRAPLVDHARWTTAVVDLQSACALFHQTVNTSPITVKKITIQGDLKVRGVWTAHKEFTTNDCPVDLTMKRGGREPLEFVRFPEKEEEEEDIEVEAPAPRPLKQPELAPRVLRNASVKASLQARVGFSGAKAVAWTSPTRCVYASGRALASVDASTGKTIAKPLSMNEHCQAKAHTEAVSLVAAAPGILASAQSCADSCRVALWKPCPREDEWLCDFAPHARAVTCLAFSHDGGRLCSVGLDAQARAQLVVFDVAKLKQKKRRKDLSFAILAKQLSDFDVTAIAWSPYEADRLVSCGRENVRFWRLRHGHLPGCPALLHEYVRDAKFTALCFEPVYGARDGQDVAEALATKSDKGDKIVFVASETGHVLQVSYAQRSLLCVLKLHEGPIRGICATPGYIVTASDDRFVRLWPPGFADFLMEAKHDAPVVSISVAPDGLRVACGTSRGALGVLDVASHAYGTLIRAHTGAILDIACTHGKFATCGEDATVRVWDEATGLQKSELASPDDRALCLAWRPDIDNVAVGFASGSVRVFDLDQTRTLHDMRQHKASVSSLQFRSARHLYSASRDGHLCLYDASQNFAVVALVHVDANLPKHAWGPSHDGHLTLATSPDHNVVACITSRDPTKVALFDASSLRRSPLSLDVAATARWPLKPLVDAYWNDMTLYLVEEDGSVCRGDLAHKTLGLNGLEDKQPAGRASSGQACVADVLLIRVCAAKHTYESIEPFQPGRRVARLSGSGEVLCGLDGKDDRIVHLRAVSKGACADVSAKLDDHSSTIKRCAFTPSDRLITCDAAGGIGVWHWERLGEVLSPTAPLGTDDAFCRDRSQLGWTDDGDPALSADPDSRGCAVKLDVVAGPVWCRCGDRIVEAAPNGIVARVAGDASINPVDLDSSSPTCCAASKDVVAFGFQESETVRCWRWSEAGWAPVPLTGLEGPCTALAFGSLLFAAHGNVVAAYVDGAAVVAQETRPVMELAAFAQKPACAALLQGGSACLFTLEDGALEETLLVKVSDAISVSTWRDAVVVLDAQGMVSFHRGAADPCYEPVHVGAGAISIECGPTNVLVAYADRVAVWALAVDDAVGRVHLTPKASLNLDAAPARVQAAPGAALGLVATAQGALWYFHADAAHDDEFAADGA